MDVISKRILSTTALSTLEGLAALEGPPQEVFTWCQETDAPYQFVPGDVTPADGVASIAPTGGGTAGRWLLLGGEIALLPTGSAAIDTARLTAVIASPLVSLIRYLDGTYTINANPGAIPTGKRWLGAGIGSTIVVSTIPNLGLPSSDPTDKLLFATASYGAAGILSAAPVVYTRTLNSALDVTTRWVRILAPLPSSYLQIFQVTQAGVGPFVYTTDRAIQRPFPNATTTIVEMTPVEGIEIGHMTFRGTGNRCYCWLGCVDLNMHDCVIEPDDAGGVFAEAGSFDTGNYDCVLTNVTCRNMTGHGHSVESGEKIKRSFCEAYGCGTAGFNVWDCIDCSDQECRGENNVGNGLDASGDSQLTVGNLGFDLVGGSYVGNGNAGIQFGRGRTQRALGVRTAGNGGAGILIAGVDATAAGLVYDTTLSGCVSTNDNRVLQLTTLGGIAILNASGVTINGSIIESPTACGVFFGAAVNGVVGNIGKISNVIVAGGRRAGLLIGGTGVVATIVGLHVDTAEYGIYVEGGAGNSFQFYVDKWTAINMTFVASVPVANPDKVTVDGVRYKPDGATTVDVSGNVRIVRLADTGATTITNPMLNARDLQQVTYVGTNGNTTINRATSSLPGGVNWVSTDDAVLGLVFRATLGVAPGTSVGMYSVVNNS